MPATKSSKDGDPVGVRLPESTLRIIDLLAEKGRHGSNRSEVIRYFITRGIDDLTGLGVIKPDD